MDSEKKGNGKSAENQNGEPQQPGVAALRKCLSEIHDDDFWKTISPDQFREYAELVSFFLWDVLEELVETATQNGKPESLDKFAGGEDWQYLYGAVKKIIALKGEPEGVPGDEPEGRLPPRPTNLPRPWGTEALKSLAMR